MEKNSHRLTSPTLTGRTWQHLRMMLLTALLAAMTGQTARAHDGNRTVTVYDGTTTSDVIPANFFHFDEFTRSQFVIPASELEDMSHATISSLTFYTNYLDSYTTTCSVDVYLMEVDYTTMTALEPKASGTTVYQGTLSIVAAGDGGTMTITFTTPYTYSGRNLLIGIENTAKGDYEDIAFYGQTVEGAAWAGFDYSSLDAVTGSQQNFIPKTTFTFTPDSSPVYFRPTSLTLADVDATTATLRWTAPSEDVTGYAYQYKPTGTEAWSTPTSVSYLTTTATLSDLTASTSYDFRVKAIYNDKESKYVTLSFTTKVIPVTVGDSWSDGFEGEAFSWLLVNGDCVNAWAWGTAVHSSSSGTRSLYVSNDGGTTNAYDTESDATVYAAKLLTFEGGKYEFNYDWRCDGEIDYDYMRVALVPATELPEASHDWPEGFSESSLPSGWIALDGGSQLNETQEWQSKSATVSSLTAGNYYLVFAWCNDGIDGNQPPAAVDNVSISRVYCADKVKDLAVGQMDYTTATLSWTATGEATQWQVTYSTNSNFVQATEVIVDLNPNLSVQICTLTGLTPYSTYYARVRAYCGGTDYGKWSDAVTIKTNPAPTDVTVTTGTSKATLSWTAYGDSYNVRYKNKGLFQGFENGLGEWTTMNCLSSTGIYETVKVNNSPRNAYNSGSHGFVFAASNNNPQSLISPELSITEGMELEFYYGIIISSYQKKFRVGFSSTTNDADAFDWQDEVTVNSSGWKSYSIDIPVGTKYICIQQTQDSYQYYLLIDDISVDQDWTTATATETGITLTGLAPETTYEYQVQSVKGGAASEWTQPATFTTLPPISIELADDGTANADALSDGDGENATVTLSGRTIHADGTWQALCLPFALSSLDDTPLAGFTVKEIDTEGKWAMVDGQWTTSSDGHQTGLDNDGKVYLHFKDATSIEAGRPYFVMKPAIEGGPQPTYTATEGTQGTDPVHQNCDKLLDGSIEGYRWRTSILPSYCMFEANNPVSVTGYTLTTGNQNNNGHPTVWTLEARISESDEWTVIDSRNANTTGGDALPSGPTENKSYDIQQRGVYKFFRFTVKETKGNTFMCLTELTMQGTPVVDNDVVNPVFTGVTIDATTPVTVCSLDGQVSITGSYDAVTASGKDRTLFFPGSDSRLFCAQADKTLGACRALFHIGDGSVLLTLGGSNCLKDVIMPAHFIGDADNDGSVTISDAIAVVNHILGNAPASFDETNADVDGNKSITIADAVAIIKMVLAP